jgi:hypothetical protein
LKNRDESALNSKGQKGHWPGSMLNGLAFALLFFFNFFYSYAHTMFCPPLPLILPTRRVVETAGMKGHVHQVGLLSSNPLQKPLPQCSEVARPLLVVHLPRVDWATNVCTPRSEEGLWELCAELWTKFDYPWVWREGPTKEDSPPAVTFPWGRR